jgi:hypothetical protein
MTMQSWDNKRNRRGEHKKLQLRETRRPDLHMYYVGIDPLTKYLLEEELEPGSLDESHDITR